MTAVQASEDIHRSAKGQHYFNDKALPTHSHNGTKNGNRALSAAFATDIFSHLTLFTGNTMVTGTTGLLNTSMKKSNQEVSRRNECTLRNRIEYSKTGRITSMRRER